MLVKKITVLLVCFLFLEKIFKESHTIAFSINFKVIDFSHLSNLVFFQEINSLPKIQTAFDENLTFDTRGIFLDISKTFDKV